MTGSTTNFNFLLILVTELTRHKLRVLLFIAVIASALALTTKWWYALNDHDHVKSQ